MKRLIISIVIILVCFNVHADITREINPNPIGGAGFFIPDAEIEKLLALIEINGNLLSMIISFTTNIGITTNEQFSSFLLLIENEEISKERLGEFFYAYLNFIGSINNQLSDYTTQEYQKSVLIMAYLESIRKEVIEVVNYQRSLREE